LLKTVILVFAALMLVQGISLMAKSILTLKGRRQDLVGN
jgi:TRAP-type mannitol/chloroaromatic compound transport system permease small subunit